MSHLTRHDYAAVLAGYLLGVSTFGWPLVVAGVLKLTYGALLFARFHGTAARGTGRFRRVRGTLPRAKRKDVRNG